MLLTAHKGEAVARSSTAGSPPCCHSPRCPAATAPDHDAAHTVAAHPEQGWSLLCNGIILFDDTGELLPDGCAVAPRRASPACRGGVPVAAAGDDSETMMSTGSAAGWTTDLDARGLRELSTEIAQTDDLALTIRAYR